MKTYLILYFILVALSSALAQSLSFWARGREDDKIIVCLAPSNGRLYPTYHNLNLLIRRITFPSLSKNQPL